MTANRLETSLARVEQLLEDMATHLVRGDAPAHQASASALRQLMGELAHASRLESAETLQQPAVLGRLQTVSQALGRQRDHLARRAVVNDRALAAVLPQPQVTYASGRSGGFTHSAARIYAAPAQ